jgi:hypothetical protein
LIQLWLGHPFRGQHDRAGLGTEAEVVADSAERRVSNDGKQAAKRRGAGWAAGDGGVRRHWVRQLPHRLERVLVFDPDAGSWNR